MADEKQIGMFRRTKEGNLVARKLNGIELDDSDYQIKLKVQNLDYNQDLIPKDVKKYIDSHRREYEGIMGQVILADMGLYENNFINEYHKEYMKKFHANTFQGNPEVERAIKTYILQKIVYGDLNREEESRDEHYDNIAKGIPTNTTLPRKRPSRILDSGKIQKEPEEELKEYDWQKRKDCGVD